MQCKQLSKIILALLIAMPSAILAQHYEMVNVDGKKVMLVWEYSFPLDYSAPVIMPEDQDVPFLRVNSTIWRPTMKNDSAFWNNLGKQLWNRECKIEPVPYTRLVDLIHNESLEQANVGYQSKSEPAKKKQDNKTKKGKTRSSEQLSISPNPADTYSILEYVLPANISGADIRICTQSGIQVWQQDIKRVRDQIIVDLTGFSTGSYLVTLNTEMKTISSKSLIISR